MTTENTHTATIAALNDQCRKAMGIAGKLFQTQGICDLSLHDQSAIREKVETFDEFTPDNDPYGERDFGAFDHNGQNFLENRLLRYDAHQRQRRADRPRADRARSHYHARR